LENPWWYSIADFAEWLIGTTPDGYETSGTKNYCGSQSIFWTQKTEVEVGTRKTEFRRRE
jgi:hypothetical protein